MKKNWSLLMLVLAAVLLLTGCASGAENPATEPTGTPEPTATPQPQLDSSGVYTYILLDDGTVMITRYSGNDEVLTLPTELDGYKVTGLGPRALTGRAGSVNSVLTTLVIPDSITNLVGNPFSRNYALEQIILSGSHPTLELVHGALIDKQEHRLITYLFPAGVDDYAVPEGILAIEDYALYNFRYHAAGRGKPESGPRGVKTLVLPASLQRIGNCAFGRNVDLAEIVIPDGVTYIGKRPFDQCDALASITLPRSICDDKPDERLYTAFWGRTVC